MVCQSIIGLYIHFADQCVHFHSYIHLETTTWVSERRLPVPVTLVEAFTYYLDITTPPTPQLLQLFQKMVLFLFMHPLYSQYLSISQ